jgi:CubicO group peptidase (beta-lactamase class C family)
MSPFKPLLSLVAIFIQVSAAPQAFLGLNSFPNSLVPEPFVARHGLNSSEYQTLFKDVTSSGYRLVQVTGYVSSSQDNFASLFLKSPGPPQICNHSLTRDGYQRAFDTAIALGFKPVLVNGYASASGSDKYVAIFEKPTTRLPWVARHALTPATYQQELDTWTDPSRGFRPTHVSGYAVGSETRYAVIFEKRLGKQPPWITRHGLTAREFEAEVAARAKVGYTPTVVSAYTVNGIDYYAVIFEKKAEGRPWIARHRMTARAYEGELVNQYYQGYRLKCISGYTIKDVARYAAVWQNPFLSSSDLERIDGPLEWYMKKNFVPGLSIAITRNDSLIFAKGFGFADKTTRERVNPDHLFRIASISKTMTAITIMTLIEQKKFSLNSTVFGEGAILDKVYGTRPYSLLTRAITVQHLLEHTSGYSNAGGDPAWLNPDTTPAQMITWLLDNRQPRSVPGRRFEYFNVGYCILGRIIERMTEQAYEPYLHNNIINSSPQSPNRMVIGNDTMADRKSNEVIYYPTSLAYRVKIGRLDSFGGWLARPIDLVGVLTRVDGLAGRPDIISPATLKAMWTGSTAQPAYGKGWIIAPGWRGHNGILTGTVAFLVTRDDGFGFAVTVNTRPWLDPSAAVVKGVIDRIIGAVAAWPAYDLF